MCGSNHLPNNDTVAVWNRSLELHRTPIGLGGVTLCRFNHSGEREGVVDSEIIADGSGIVWDVNRVE
jgi:hypothetical protein